MFLHILQIYEVKKELEIKSLTPACAGAPARSAGRQAQPLSKIERGGLGGEGNVVMQQLQQQTCVTIYSNSRL